MNTWESDFYFTTFWISIFFYKIALYSASKQTQSQGCQELSFRIFYDKAADEVTDIVADRIDFTEQ